MIWIPIPLILFAVQASDPTSIFTDRPDFTEGTQTMPVGMAQIEGGITFSDERDQRTWVGPEALLRFGLSETAEARIGLPDYTIVQNGGRSEGLGDSYFGVKFRLPNSGPLELALIPGVSLPTGRDGFTSDAFDPQLVLAWAGLTLGEYDLSGGFVASRVSDSGDHTTVFSSTLTFGKSLSERTGFFFEYAGQFERHVGPAHLLHSGFTFQLRENVQADIHFGVGLSRTAPRSFVGAGLAYRF